MKEKGVDITCYKSKGFKEIYGINFDYVITMGCGDACPLYPASRRIDWLIPDPKGKQIDFFRKIRDEIESKIKDFINNLHS
jgi:protein-tyrosine-phosphatase